MKTFPNISAANTPANCPANGPANSQTTTIVAATPRTHHAANANQAPQSIPDRLLAALVIVGALGAAACAGISGTFSATPSDAPASIAAHIADEGSPLVSLRPTPIADQPGSLSDAFRGLVSTITAFATSVPIERTLGPVRLGLTPLAAAGSQPSRLAIHIDWQGAPLATVSVDARVCQGLIASAAPSTETPADTQPTLQLVSYRTDTTPVATPASQADEPEACGRLATFAPAIRAFCNTWPDSPEYTNRISRRVWADDLPISALADPFVDATASARADSAALSIDTPGSESARSEAARAEVPRAEAMSGPDHCPVDIILDATARVAT